MEKLYHIQLDDSHGARYAIMPGDPGRVELIANLLDEPRFLVSNREYTSWIGSLEGENVLVTSHGIGGPSTAIAVEELYRTGVRNFIRVGTCGGMDLEVAGGDLVIATAAIRMEGTSREYVPIEFPAVANWDLTASLVEEAEYRTFPYHTGVVQCKDSFYGQHDPERMPAGYELKNKWDAWIKAKTLASEMESATLFIVAQVLGARAACILTTIWNQERIKQGLDDDQAYGSGRAIKTAVEAVRRDILKQR
ncbi:MAG: uridine phosphorylase [Clostridiaceae bacterium]|jgi:uridine phosphorylase|nr:uridine phosphorylase [Clostridiaceae bacterium]HZJ90538.1 uridine phosphorylase [Oscillospiraceae bacterium]